MDFFLDLAPGDKVGNVLPAVRAATLLPGFIGVPHPRQSVERGEAVLPSRPSEQGLPFASVL